MRKRKADATDPSPRRLARGFVQTGALVQKRVGQVGESRGFAVTRLLTRWAEICGPEIAAVSQPLKVSYARDGLGATLILACEGARAPEVQMQEPVIRERVNACYGYNAISRVRIEQRDAAGFAEARAAFAPARPPTEPPTDPAIGRAAGERVAGVADESLRTALHRLAENIMSRKGQRKPASHGRGTQQSRT